MAVANLENVYGGRADWQLRRQQGEKKKNEKVFLLFFSFQGSLALTAAAQKGNIYGGKQE